MAITLSTGSGSSSPSFTGITEDLTTVDSYIGKGTSDADIIFLALKNKDGEQVFIYPNATQNGVVVTSVRP